ncbi:MAG: hypothetical protein ACYS8Z_23545, partial [Planctomycetota bacterium]
YNGEELGFNIFKEVIRRVHSRYDNLTWMKLSEIARYWAAKELTRIEKVEDQVQLQAPFATKNLTIRTQASRPGDPLFGLERSRSLRLRRVDSPLKLESGTWTSIDMNVIACFDLPKGKSVLEV